MDQPNFTQRKHGGKSAPVACRHIVRHIESMSTRNIGFHWAPSDTRLFPDAWCTRCDAALAAAGGRRTPEIVKRMGMQEVCSCCYEMARLESDPACRVETIRWR
jgi:hypothetical protein